MKVIKGNQLEALIYFGGITENSFDYYRLSGNHLRNIRREFLSMWTGKKLPLAKCGVNAIYKTLADYFEPVGKSLGARQADLQDIMRDTVNRNTLF